MLHLSKRESGDWLRREEIKKIPCDVLYEIDKLWLNHSTNKFGFSIQQKIWVSIGDDFSKINIAIFRRFGDCVGWRRNSNWIEYDDFDFSLNAEKGHFPFIWIR